MRNGCSTPNHAVSGVVLCLLLVLQTAFAGTTNAAEFCLDMRRLMVQAESNFLEIPTHSKRVVKPLPIAGANNCSMARALSAANTFHCAWEFAYRADAAIDAFNHFDAQLKACFGGLTELAKDLGVNHPDFYDLRQYRLGQVVLTLSLKDKSALQQTYVFVGVQGFVQR